MDPIHMKYYPESSALPHHWDQLTFTRRFNRSCFLALE